MLFYGSVLTLGFDGLFDFALLFLFLLLELVGDEFKDGHLRAVPDADPRGDNPGVAPRAIGKLWRDFTKEFLRNGRRHDVAGRLTPRLQGVFLAEGDHFFRHRARGFRARERGGDPSVLEEV